VPRVAGNGGVTGLSTVAKTGSRAIQKMGRMIRSKSWEDYQEMMA